MTTKFATYWYKDNTFVKNAFLYNCRDADLAPLGGARIDKGSIVAGTTGYVAAEMAVPGFSAAAIKYYPNRRCAWQNFELACMAHPDVPVIKASQGELRRHNYIVAELPNRETVEMALRLKIPVLADDQGHNLVNLEIACFQRQGQANPRRAKLL